MTEKHRIVVAYDASAESDAALAWAARTAGAQHAQLCVRVVASDMDPAVHSSRAVNELHAHRRLACAAATLEQLGVQQAELAVVHGPVFPALLREGGETATLVLGSRGHSLLHGAVHGSVSQEIARYSHGPVVVVRPCEDPESQRIVVGVDGWPASLAALEWAAQRAADTGEQLVAFTVVPAGRRQRGGVEHLDERTRAEYDVAVLRLHRELNRLRRAFPGVRMDQEIQTGKVNDLLVARSRHAALLVLGARTQDPIVDLVLGSTSQGVLAAAHCPVALIHAVPVGAPAAASARAEP